MKAWLAALLLSFGFTAPEAQAIPDDRDYLRTWREVLLPMYQARGNAGSLIARDGVRLDYRVFSDQRSHRAVLILPGRTEPAAQYAEVVDDLLKAGHMVFILDHRGQGASQRLLNDPHKGHVADFNDYVDDLAQFMVEVVRPAMRAKRIPDCHLLAHSMGAAVGILYMARDEYRFRSAVLSSPMVQIRVDPLPMPLARALVGLQVRRGLGHEFLVGNGRYKPEPFRGNRHTHSRNRHAMNQELIRLYPQLALGGPTNRWVREAFRVTEKVLAKAERIRIPTLVLMAGQDRIVRPHMEARFCAAVRRGGGECQLRKYPGAHHEILLEKDHVRGDAMARAVGWFAR